MWSLWATIALGATPEQTEVVLDRVRASLERVRAHRVSPHRLETLPGWVDLAGADLAEDPGDLGTLQEALSSGKPLERALAARWIASGADPAGMVALEGLLDDAQSAGWLPETVITQLATREPEVRWVSLTVGEVALRSLAQLAGQPWSEPEQYRQWRARHPDPEKAPEVWRYLVTVRPELRERLEGLGPELALRVRLLEGTRDEEGLREAWREHIGPERTAALISGEERWPEHDSEHALGEFVRWAVFELDRPSLEALWQTGSQAPGPRWTRTSVALALGRVDPSRREALLTEVLSDPSAGPIDGVLSELAQHHFDSQKALLAQYLSLPDGTTSSDQGRIALLRTLAGPGEIHRDKLVSLLASSQFQSDDPRVVEALAWAAQRTGLIDPPAENTPCRGPFAPRPNKGVTSDVTELTDMLLRRRLCVAAVLAEVR